MLLKQQAEYSKSFIDKMKLEAEKVKVAKEEKYKK
jgi:hypothetical protein